MTDGQGGGVETEIPASVFETLEELWRILSEYVFADEYDDALRVAREAVSRWHNADAASALAWVVTSLVNTPASRTRNWSPRDSMLLSSRPGGTAGRGQELGERREPAAGQF